MFLALILSYLLGKHKRGVGKIEKIFVIGKAKFWSEKNKSCKISETLVSYTSHLTGDEGA